MSLGQRDEYKNTIKIYVSHHLREVCNDNNVRPSGFEIEISFVIVTREFRNAIEVNM